MRYYIDCEFDGHTGPLLSIAMVRHDGHSIHIRTTEDAKDPWVRANVMPVMRKHNADMNEMVHLLHVGDTIREFIGDDPRPRIIADSPVDIGRFCTAITTGATGQWKSCDYPLMEFSVFNLDVYPTALQGAVQHNAWWDALALWDKLEGQS